jgi:TPP-dependent pyruvate/acetoin dehydrogenase alpha subunit
MAMINGFDPGGVYESIVRMRFVEEAITKAWADGIVPGEYHSCIGEEAINTGVLQHLSSRDSLHLDHRNTSALVGRGADITKILLEIYGSQEGMNRGAAGHMHLIEPDVKAAADGMVGSGGPMAVGAAFANRQLAPGAVSVTFHGEATFNQGYLMEGYNMAGAWKLPVIFVCKDNKWSISTYSKEVTGGDLIARAASFGLNIEKANGDKVKDVYAAAGRLVDKARNGDGPGFLYVTCHRPAGHFEGDPIVRLVRDPKGMAEAWGPSIMASVQMETGGSMETRTAGIATLAKRGARAGRDWAVNSRKDPVRRARSLIEESAAERIEKRLREEVTDADTEARRIVGERPVFGVSAGGAK